MNPSKRVAIITGASSGLGREFARQLDARQVADELWLVARNEKALNCRGLVDMTRATLPYMERGSRIIQVASAAAFTPLPHMNVYAATKSFVLHYTRALRWELHGTGITATALCPTWVKTGFEKVARTSGGGHDVGREQGPFRRGLREPSVGGAAPHRQGRSLLHHHGRLERAASVVTFPRKEPPHERYLFHAFRDPHPQQLRRCHLHG